MMKNLLFLIILIMLCYRVRAQEKIILVEAENFAKKGGWVVDQQFMDEMGSPYLLAHGLGVKVENAATTVSLKNGGKYRVWVRTKDWVAPWNADGAPGKFNLDLYMNSRANEVIVKKNRISAVVAENIITGERNLINGTLFADCTGDGVIGYLAGRDVSVTHQALGSVRVMRTGGLMGEVVGIAAYLCKKHSATPREIYTLYLSDLKDEIINKIQ